MGKESKKNPYLLLITSALLLGTAFLLPLPGFAFIGIVPLFELVDQANERSFLRRLGKLPLILFWLAIEYIAYSVGENFSLGNAIIEKINFIRWEKYTGLSGVSLWILFVNLSVYYSDLWRGVKWGYAVAAVIVFVGPILYSYTLPSEPVVEGGNEWVARTAAWISVLVLLSAIVKEFIRKK